LNYLAFKVIEFKRTFNKHHVARPLVAIYIAGLTWNDMDEKTRGRIVELSKKLHEKAPGNEYSNQGIALKEMAGLPEFKELVKILDSKVDRSKPEEALARFRFQSGEGEKEPEEKIKDVMLRAGIFTHS
jgi:hypothetical protein